MKLQSIDTHPEAERVHVNLLRQVGSARRLKLALSLSRSTAEMFRRTVRQRYPYLCGVGLKLELVALCYGEQLAERLAGAGVLEEAKALETPDIAQALVPLLGVFERMGIGYHVGGSVASSAHGLPRTTIDIDLVADLGPHHVQRLVAALQAEYYIDGDMIRGALQHQIAFNLIHLATLVKVDIFPLKTTTYDQQAFKRAVLGDSAPEQGGLSVWLASAEDVALHKLTWYQMGNRISERQWNDVLGVLKVQAEALDLEYMRRWAAHLAVGELLEQALQDAGLALA